MSSNGEKKINFYPNDPIVKEAPLEEIEYRLENTQQKWDIDGGLSRAGIFNPGTLDFQVGQINLTLSKCIQLWSDIFKDKFRSWSSVQALTVFPQVDYRTVPGHYNGFNAFYNRRSLAFFYDKDKITNKTAFTCESLDIIGHETGHAILDAVHSDFWNIILPEVRAFHEAFGDCSSILTTLTNANVRKAFLRVQNPLYESNLVSRLAEEMGHGIYSVYGRDGSSPDSLRDAINDFTYQDPTKLPDKGPDTILTKGSHSFARVFSGAFYGSLVRMYQLLAGEISEKDKALTTAANNMGEIFGHALSSVSPTNLLYREIALEMLKADDKIFNGKFRQAILDAFVEKKILSSVIAPSLAENIKLQTATGSATPLSDIKIPENIQEITSGKFAKDVSQSVGFSDSEKLDINVERGLKSNSFIVRGRSNAWEKLKVTDPELSDEIETYLPSGFAMVIDSDKKSIVSHVHINDPRTIEEAEAGLQYLVKSNKIYRSKGNDEIDTMELAILHKPFYISEDKKLLRAYFAHLH